MRMPDPKRLAAADMFGQRGGRRRSRIILGEFIVGAVLCTALGVLGLFHSTGVWLALGVWLIGVGANYVVLAREALRLSGPNMLAAAMRGRDIKRELRGAARAQLWIAVPFSLCVAKFAGGER